MKMNRSSWFYLSLLLLVANLLFLTGGFQTEITSLMAASDATKSCDDSGICVECEWQTDAEGHRVQVKVPSGKNPDCGSCDGTEFVKDCSESTCTDCDLCSGEDSQRPGGLEKCEACDRGEQEQRCGKVDGKKCGECTKKKEICDTSDNTCYNPCERAEAKCGTVEGVECENQCDAMPKKICNEEKNTCYNPCNDKSVECGKVEGIKCENECKSKKNKVCDPDTNKCVTPKSDNEDDTGPGGGNGNGPDDDDDEDEDEEPDCEPKDCPDNACGTIDDGCGGTKKCGDCSTIGECGVRECEKNNRCSAPTSDDELCPDGGSENGGSFCQGQSSGYDCCEWSCSVDVEEGKTGPFSSACSKFLICQVQYDCIYSDEYHSSCVSEEGGDCGEKWVAYSYFPGWGPTDKERQQYCNNFSPPSDCCESPQ